MTSFPSRTCAPPDDRAFIAVLLLSFFGSAAATVAWCDSMSAMPGMAMPGGWSMSMMWMRMPGQSWLAAAATFLGMWTLMMAAMMLPALAPALRVYRAGLAFAGQARINTRTAGAAAGYLFVWALAGALLYLVSAMLAAFAMQAAFVARAAPGAAAGLLLLAGALQASGWKSRRLACCRHSLCEGAAIGEARAAWKLGARLGLRCTLCCAPLTALLFVMGAMDLAAMALVTAAITLERLAPRGDSIARTYGLLLMLAGLYVLQRAA